MRANHYGATTTTDEVLRGIDLRGKVAVVTGSSTGLGLETSRALAQAGATVVMAARDRCKNTGALATVRAQVPAARLLDVTLDLGDLNSVRRASARILAVQPRIDLIVNNAGVMACPLTRTAEGCEGQFGTNHVGHFLFTCLLAPALRKSAAARVVCLSSSGHMHAAMDFDDPHFERRPYDPWIAYGQSKTANVLFAVALSQRLGRFGIHANAVHPGAIATELGRYLGADDIQRMLAAFGESAALVYKDVKQGAATSVWAAVAPELAGVGGRYLEDCALAAEAQQAMALTGYMPYAVDPAAAERLWRLSEDIVGQRFDFG